jgi:hypothetical protein
LIGRGFAKGSVARRLATRAVVILGAVLVGGQLMRGLPKDQTLVFPVGSVFPRATGFSASWRAFSEREPRGGVTRRFDAGPPLQVREHAKLPDGDYIVTIDVSERPAGTESTQVHSELQTSIERRVNLVGGETMILLTANARPSVPE